MKKILITGASGFIGKRLSSFFLSKGYHVKGTGTSLAHPYSAKFDKFEWIQADTTKQGAWQKHVAKSDIIINLAGQNIFKYWTKKYKQAIYDSRILTTKNIVHAMEKGKNQKLLTTSAVGYYGDGKDEVLTEEKEPGKGFLVDVCKDWEHEALKSKKKGVKVSVMRFGVVLGEKGALPLMLPAFKLFAGGPVGSGRQWFPWVHVKDLEKMVEFLIDHEDLDGIFNFVSPEPVRQKLFAKKLGRVLHRPSFFLTPAFMMKSVMGELGSTLLQSQNAFPGRLMDSGYTFLFSSVDAALNDLLGGKK